MLNSHANDAHEAALAELDAALDDSEVGKGQLEVHGHDVASGVDALEGMRHRGIVEGLDDDGLLIENNTIIINHDQLIQELSIHFKFKLFKL